ncbi:MAG TPA: pilus assembly protein PilM, partial [Candidatus Wallbacteria bacterium]|nr:pilus assembly protein PilM [Candidatus Wallbacteria bacterium]
MAPAAGEENFIIIDIGSSIIKAAQAFRSESGVSFSAMAVESVIEQKQLSEADAAAIIKLMMASAGMSSSRAVFVLSGNQILIRHIDFPKMPEEALEKNIKNEMKKELGAPAENLIYHHITLKEFESKNDDGTAQKKIKVLICAVDQAVTARIKAIAGAAGLTLHSIISSGLSFYSLAVKMGALETLLPDEVLMFLDFGNSQITTNFISKDGLRFSKDINMGGSTLTTVIKTLNQGGAPITMSEAEELKFKIGIMSQETVDGMDDTAPNANLHKVLNVSFRKLLQRIRLSTGYFFTHFKESVSFQALKTIYLLGGNCEIKG